MAGPSEDALHKILAKIDDLEARVQELESRLDVYEAERENTLASHTEPEPIINPVRPVIKASYKPAMPLEPVPASNDFSAAHYEEAAEDTRDPSTIAATLARKPAPAGANISTPPPMPVPTTPKESWEVRIATKWLPWIAGIFLALVLILFAREQVRGPVGKVVGCYLLSLALIVAGLFKERKYPQWARPVFAAGLAFSYFTTYAMGFAEPMRLLDSLSAKLALLAVNLAVIIGFAQWKRSEVIAGTALVLGYLTTGSVGSDAAALWSCVALSVVALLFLWRNQWFVSTAVAAAATYLAYFYVWKAVPEAVERSAQESFWYHFMFLSLAFLVYTAAGLVGKGAASAEAVTTEGKNKQMSRRDLLTVLTQTNVAAYITAMIILLKTTGVYWNQSLLFFFPLAAVCAVLGAAFVGLRKVQVTYLTAAVVCFTFGVISAASPKWLPVFLALQAVTMLVGASNRQHPGLWFGLSLLVLLYACGYLVTDGQIDRIGLTKPLWYDFPWWTFAGVSALVLVYACAWEKLVPGKLKNTPVEEVTPYVLAAGAVLLWRFVPNVFDSKQNSSIVYAIAVPAVTLATVLARTKAPVLFACITALLCVINEEFIRLFTDSPDKGDSHFWLNLPYFLLGMAGLCAAWLAERLRLNDTPLFRILWSTVYVWAQLMLAAGLTWASRDWAQVYIYVVVFALIVATGWLVRSAAMAKSGYVFILFALGYAINTRVASIWWPVSSVLLLLAAAYPLATPLWRRRTGDSCPPANRWGQAAVVLAAGLVFLRGVAVNDGNLAFAAGAWALVSALNAATGRFRTVAAVAIAYVGFLALLVSFRLVVSSHTGMSPGAEVCWSLAGVLLVIAAERVMKFGPKLAWPWSDREPWLTPDTMRWLTNAVAIGMLFTTVMILRPMPELRLFYFTGAMVGAAFVWIVLGFWFNEPVYRKSGFALLCVGILKGLVWDVLELKNSLYRQISWTVLGLLALAASFLYNKFRGRME